MPIQPDDVILNKCSIIERCLKRIAEEHSADPTMTNFTHLDAMTLNIERACQAAIDSAMHLVSQKKLGIPQNSADAFSRLHKAGILNDSLVISLRAMCGFRNVAIHEYQEMDMSVLNFVVTKGVADFRKYCLALGVTIS